MNIHCLNDDWEFRLKHILNRFIETSPELIALQEVCIDSKTQLNQIEYIRDYLQQRGYPVRELRAQYTHVAWERFDEYVVLISKLRVAEFDQGFLPVSLLQRGFVAFNINQAWYINTHLEFKAENAIYRKKQIEFLMQRFTQAPHLIVGDFNSAPGSPEQSSLGNSGYYAFFPGDSHLGDDGNASRRIDGIWFSPQFYGKTENLHGGIILNEKVQDRYLSDHFAVYAQFSLKN
jgi:endonuclease/exonuclease/phosphatase family metal-dependent hydrolase